MPRNPQVDRKQQRLEAALRENLKRRKGQERQRHNPDKNSLPESQEDIEPGEKQD